jgi:hypothetical protein
VDLVNVYSLNDGHWHQFTLSESRTEMAAVTIDDMAVFAGGRHSEPNGAVNFVKDIDAYYDCVVPLPSDGK